MPPRPPPSPPILTILCSIAALVGVWLSLAVDQLARAAVLALLGVSVGPVAADERFFIVVLHGPLGGLGPWSFAFVVLTGTLAVVGLALVISWVTSTLRSAVRVQPWRKVPAPRFVLTRRSVVYCGGSQYKASFGFTTVLVEMMREANAAPPGAGVEIGS